MNLSYHLEKVFDTDIPALHMGTTDWPIRVYQHPTRQGPAETCRLFPSVSNPFSHHPRLTSWIKIETSLREFCRLQIGPEIPPVCNGPILTGFLCQARIRVVRVTRRGGSESELRTVRRDVGHRSRMEMMRIPNSHSPRRGLTATINCRMKVSGEHFEDWIIGVHWDPIRKDGG